MLFWFFKWSHIILTARKWQPNFSRNFIFAYIWTKKCPNIEIVHILLSFHFPKNSLRGELLDFPSHMPGKVLTSCSRCSWPISLQDPWRSYISRGRCFTTSTSLAPHLFLLGWLKLNLTLLQDQIRSAYGDERWW